MGTQKYRHPKWETSTSPRRVHVFYAKVSQNLSFHGCLAAHTPQSSLNHYSTFHVWATHECTKIMSPTPFTAVVMRIDPRTHPNLHSNLDSKFHARPLLASTSPSYTSNYSVFRRAYVFRMVRHQPLRAASCGLEPRHIQPLEP